MTINKYYFWCGYQNFDLGPFWLIPSPWIQYFKYGADYRTTGEKDLSSFPICEYINYHKSFMFGIGWLKWGYCFGVEWTSK